MLTLAECLDNNTDTYDNIIYYITYRCTLYLYCVHFIYFTMGYVSAASMSTKGCLLGVFVYTQI